MYAEVAASSEVLSDKELVYFSKDGDTAAFAILTERYMPLLKSRAGRYSNVVGVDVEDFVQEGMLALFKAVKGYDADAGIQFRTYAVICINNSMATAIKTHMKNVVRNNGVSIDVLDDAELHQRSLTQLTPMLIEDSFIEREDSFLRALRIKSLLSDFEQRVLTIYLQGHSYQQISHQLDTTTKAVDNALQRVRQKLRPEL